MVILYAVCVSRGTLPPIHSFIQKHHPENRLIFIGKLKGKENLIPASFRLSLTVEPLPNIVTYLRVRVRVTRNSWRTPMISMGNSWHPAPAGHRLVADILFMHYAKVFLRAMSRLEKVSPGWTATELRKQNEASIHSLGVSLELWEDEHRSNEAGDYALVSRSNSLFMGGGRGRALPSPSWCTSWRFCRGAGNYRCANTYYPLAGGEGSRLLDMVSERTSVLNSKCKNLVVKPNTGHWSLTLNEEKPSILEYLKTGRAPKGKHLPIDTKWVLVGNKASGPIEFEFETLGVPQTRASKDVSVNGTAAEGTTVAVDDSRVVVCKPDFIRRVELGSAGDVRYSIDGVQTMTVRLLSHFGLHEGSCVLLAAEIGVGRHTLTVEPLKDGQPYVAISHIIYPA